MARNRDHSMLYGALVGFGIFAGILFLFVLRVAWRDDINNKYYIPFPEGTQVTQTDDHGGFHGDGIATITAHIPPDASNEYAQKLIEDGFMKTPISEYAHLQLRSVKEANDAIQVTNGLWYFRDDSPREFPNGNCENYLFIIYDLDACIYYSIEYDS